MTSLQSRLPDLDQLSLRERIAQLVFVRIGSNLPPVRTVEQDVERVERLLQECSIGGLLLFNGGLETKASLERLQRETKVPLLVASDIERGVGQQVKYYTLFPHAMAFEKLDRNAAETVAAFAQLLAEEARAAGIHISFGPVADVNTNPKNPIIATRAFSENPDRAAELCDAYVAAAEAAGLRTAAKHFPGHGDTHQDSHDSLPSVPRSLNRLEECELVPFRAAISAGCSLVMTAHVAYPAVDPSGSPATLSRTLLQDVLRDRLGFRGVICSDSLLMAGVRGLFTTEEEMALATITAGVDLLLDVNEPAKIVDYLVGCIERGHLDERRVDDAFDRVWSLKQRAFADADAHAAPTADGSNAAAARLANQVAQGAVEVIGGTNTAALPFARDEPLAAILLKPFETPIEPPEQPLAAALRERFRQISYLQLGPCSDASAFESALEQARDAKHVLVAMIVRPAAWHAFGLRPEQSEFVRRLIEEREVVLASLGVPYALSDYAQAAVRICTYSDVPVSQQALAEFLSTGQLAI